MIGAIDIGAATIGTLVGTAIIVAALAFYLISIAATLRHVSFTVGTVVIGVRAIANQTKPLAPVVRDIVSDIKAIEDGLEGLVEGTRRPALSRGRSRAIR